MIGELGVERELLARAVFVKPQISRVCKFHSARAFALWVSPQASWHLVQPNSSKPLSPLLALLEPH
jgi:hypothetical protein